MFSYGLPRQFFSVKVSALSNFFFKKSPRPSFDRQKSIRPVIYYMKKVFTPSSDMQKDIISDEKDI